MLIIVPKLNYPQMKQDGKCKCSPPSTLKDKNVSDETQVTNNKLSKPRKHTF